MEYQNIDIEFDMFDSTDERNIAELLELEYIMLEQMDNAEYLQALTDESRIIYY